MRAVHFERFAVLEAELTLHLDAEHEVERAGIGDLFGHVYDGKNGGQATLASTRTYLGSFGDELLRSVRIARVVRIGTGAGEHVRVIVRRQRRIHRVRRRRIVDQIRQIGKLVVREGTARRSAAVRRMILRGAMPRRRRNNGHRYEGSDDGLP